MTLPSSDYKRHLALQQDEDDSENNSQSQNPTLVSEVTCSDAPVSYPTRIDESDDDYFYFGHEDSNGWNIRRQHRLTSRLEFASSTNNTEYSDLSTAWHSRGALNYQGGA